MFSKEIEAISEYSSSFEEQNQSDFDGESEPSVAQVEPSLTPTMVLKRNFQAFVGSLQSILQDNSAKDIKVREMERENTRLHFELYDVTDTFEKNEITSREQAATIRVLKEKLQVLEKKQREHQLDSEASIARIVHLENKAKKLKTVHQADEKVKVTLEARIANLETKVAHQKIAIKELASELTHSASVSKTSASEKADGAAARRLAPASPNKLLFLSEAANRREKLRTSSSLERRDSSKENLRSPLL